jgi:hypothetical protein
MRTKNLELTFWASVKDSTSPTVLKTYLERYPNGEFAPIAQALIDHYVQQIKAEQAAREEERKRQEETRKAAEVKRLGEERRVREAALAEELRRAEETKNSGEAKRVAERERAELVARTEELRKALDDARRAREAAGAAEQQRLAAVKAADDATKAAEQAIAAKRDAEAKSGDPQKAASLPKLDKPPVAPKPPAAPVLSFEGDWRVTISCKAADGGQPFRNQYTAKVQNGHLQGQYLEKGTAGSHALSGRISADGYAQLGVAGLTGAPTYSRNNTPAGTKFYYPITAQFQGSHGTGWRTDGLRECSAMFSKQ